MKKINRFKLIKWAPKFDMHRFKARFKAGYEVTKY